MESPRGPRALVGRPVDAKDGPVKPGEVEIDLPRPRKKWNETQSLPFSWISLAGRTRTLSGDLGTPAGHRRHQISPQTTDLARLRWSPHPSSPSSSSVAQRPPRIFGAKEQLRRNANRLSSPAKAFMTFMVLEILGKGYERVIWCCAAHFIKLPPSICESYSNIKNRPEEGQKLHKHSPTRKTSCTDPAVHSCTDPAGDEHHRLVFGVGTLQLKGFGSTSVFLF